MDYVWIPAVAVIRLTFSKFQPTTFYHEMKTLLIYFMISKILRHLFVIERARFWRLMAALSLLTAQEWNRCLLFHVVLGFTRLSVLDQKCVNEKSKISRQMLIPVLQYCDLEDGQCKFGANFLNCYHPHILNPHILITKVFVQEIRALVQAATRTMIALRGSSASTSTTCASARNHCQWSKKHIAKGTPHPRKMSTAYASAGDYCQCQKITLPTHP